MGHDHDVIAASPEDLAGPIEPEPRAPLWRSLLLGALFAAALGGSEMAWRMHAELTPSVARRSIGLLLNAALAYAPAGALATLLLAGVSRALEARYAPGFQRALAGLSCLLLAGSTFAAAIASSSSTLPRIPPAEGAPAPEAPNLILIVIDTLRADALGAYGGPSTPTIDGLASEGLVFDEVVAPSSWTLPSMASLFTGAYPASHRYTDFDGALETENAPLHLAESLSAAGWECRAVVGNTLLDPARGFARGFSLFDAYDFSVERELWVVRGANWVLRKTGHVRSKRRSLIPVVTPRFPFVGTRLSFYNLDEDLTDRVARYALPAPTERPLFLYVHYIAPHTPYLEHPLEPTFGAPEPREVPADELRALYAGEVQYADQQVGVLLGHLERAGLLDNAVICLTADHGEAFDEHGRYEHGYDLHREAVRVPWILSARGPAASDDSAAALAAGTRFRDPVSLVALAPTLLDLVGVASTGYEGPSLLPTLSGAGPAPSPVFADTSSRFLTPDAHHVGAFAGPLRLLRIDGPEPAELLFDTGDDPGETQPLEGRPEAEALSAALEAYTLRAAAEAARIERAEREAADLERMRALGYTDGGGEEE